MGFRESDIPDQIGRVAVVTGANSGGDYYGPGRMFEMVGPPRPARSMPASKNRETAARLWEVSERLTGVAFGI